MKVNEVPQDDPKLSTKELKELCYAVDEDGNYTSELSQGWKPKADALHASIEAINEQAEIYRQKALQQEISPVQYLMELKRMDLRTVAAYTGFFKWSVKRHFKFAVFSNLSEPKKMKYCNTFDLSLEELNGLSNL